MGRKVIRVKGTHIVVRFKTLMAAAGSESWVPAAGLEDSLWTGTVAASVVEAEYAITTADSMKGACIIKCVLEI